MLHNGAGVIEVCSAVSETLDEFDESVHELFFFGVKKDDDED